MAWNLATAKNLLRIPLVDSTKDPQIQIAMETVLASVESLLGRGLLEKRELVTFYDVANSVRLPRYPVKQVVAVNGAPASLVRDQLHHRKGVLRLSGLYSASVTVDYIGGFDPLPSDLERALWEIFNYLWSNTDQTTGGPAAGSGAQIVQGSGEVSRITLSDFGSVSFDVGSQVSGGSSSGGAAAAADVWGWLAPWATTLSIYRSDSAPGVVFA